MNLSTPARVVATWLAIFPLVLATQLLLRPVTGDWPLPLTTGLVMTIVVPVAVVWTVPAVLRAWSGLGRTAGR